jgi:ppGpp synthetase/RelA/SpoT-type nucleotidyltranferase
MAANIAISQEEKQQLDAIVARYESEIKGFERLTANLQLLLSEVPLVHSLRARAKDPSHLYGKLLTAQTVRLAAPSRPPWSRS